MLIAIVKSPDGKQTSELSEHPVVLGRYGTLRIPDRRVSKRHARLRRDGGVWYVEDLGSTNGTFVNGTRVLRACPVKEGDELRMGSSVVVISRLASRGREDPQSDPDHVAPVEGTLVAAAESILAPAAEPRATVERESDERRMDDADSAVRRQATAVAALPGGAPPALATNAEPAPPALNDAAPVNFLYSTPTSDVDTMPANLEDVAIDPFLDDEPDVEEQRQATEAPDSAALPDDDPVAEIQAPSVEPSPAEDTPADALGDPAIEALELDAPAIDPAAQAVSTTPPVDELLAAARELGPAAPADAVSATAPLEEPPAPATAPEPGPADRDEPAPADDALDPRLTELPAKRPERGLQPPDDEAILFSIRPMAHRHDDDEAEVPRWRRMLPYSVLALVLFIVAANLVLVALFRREARRDARELREALARQDQATANLLVAELRAELRSPSPQQLQAMQDLGDGLLNRQTVLTEKLGAELAAQREAGAAALATAREKAAPDESGKVLLRELAEIKQAIAALPKTLTPLSPLSSSSSPSARDAAGAAATAPDDIPVEAVDSPIAPAVPAAAAVPAVTAVAVPAAAAVPAVTAVAVPAAAAVAVAPAKAAPAAPAVIPDPTAPQRSFLIDASAALEHAIPEAVATVRRTLETSRRRGGPVRILLLYQGRLIELPQAALESRDVDPIDRGPADLAAAIKAALADRPPTLYLLTDTLGGDLDASLGAIRATDAGQTTINVVQFFSRDRREQLKALARQYHGEYSYVAPPR